MTMLSQKTRAISNRYKLLVSRALNRAEFPGETRSRHFFALAVRIYKRGTREMIASHCG